MRVHIGSDHAGFELKAYLKDELTKAGYEVVDHGADTYNSDDDYPSFCIAAAEGVISDPGSLGIVIGGSGNGEQISANKVKGIRAILAWNEDTAKLGREHNNANVVSIGARQHSKEEALQLVKWFLETPFSEGERHIRRINKLTNFENGGSPEEEA